MDAGTQEVSTHVKTSCRLILLYLTFEPSIALAVLLFSFLYSVYCMEVDNVAVGIKIKEINRIGLQ